ncbi:DUF6048 family protein [Flavobacteriaceae bacterium F89]|uniref:DUF6048 family protein n=1 Tax=Cerina litoralis TaxID=2874477 RepID=A0AAE3JSF1_9FLAO|nr:DUF6048 family protein [Cerina litoralis]MCG2462433.1 DUF6048 family protein [Cerina litoralis]
MLKYFISLCLLLGYFTGQCQNKPIDLQAKDTVVYSERYGLRVGVDLSRIILSMVRDGYTGMEFVGDYRLTQKIYLAAELGNEKYDQQEDLYDFTTSGSYLKFGVDYNTYENWYGMNNSIFIGGRYAISSFNQTVNDHSIYGNNRYWYPDGFAPGIAGKQDYSGLSAMWLEFILGAKAELFANFFLGVSARLELLISNKEPDNFSNLWIPGFNKTTEGTRFGVGYNYTLTYFIPLYKKARKSKKPKEEETEE